MDGDLHDYCLEQLDIILHRFCVLFEDVEPVKQILMQ